MGGIQVLQGHLLFTQILFLLPILPLSTASSGPNHYWSRSLPGRYSQRPSHIGPVPHMNPVLTEWSQWGRWSPCSRSCNTGVRMRKRHCIATTPRVMPGSGIRTSHNQCGGARIQYDACSNRACPSSEFVVSPETQQVTFRAAQCRRYNNRKVFGKLVTRWVPYTQGVSNPCALVCEGEGQGIVYTFGKVSDGTHCTSQENKEGLCVNGRCLRISCDGQLGGAATEDRCGVCGGLNTTCTLHKGVFHSPAPLHPASLGPKTSPGKGEEDGQRQADQPAGSPPSTHAGSVGYYEVTTIPRGSTNVKITDNSHNFLALREREKFLLNGDWLIDWPGDLEAAGARFSYARTENDSEELTSLGPTKSELYLMILLREGNPGVYYEYWTPNNRKINQKKRSKISKASHVIQSANHGPRNGESLQFRSSAAIHHSNNNTIIPSAATPPNTRRQKTTKKRHHQKNESPAPSERNNAVGDGYIYADYLKSASVTPPQQPSKGRKRFELQVTEREINGMGLEYSHRNSRNGNHLFASQGSDMSRNHTAKKELKTSTSVKMARTSVSNRRQRLFRARQRNNSNINGKGARRNYFNHNNNNNITWRRNGGPREEVSSHHFKEEASSRLVSRTRNLKRVFQNEGRMLTPNLLFAERGSLAVEKEEPNGSLRSEKSPVEVLGLEEDSSEGSLRGTRKVSAKKTAFRKRKARKKKRKKKNEKMAKNKKGSCRRCPKVKQMKKHFCLSDFVSRIEILSFEEDFGSKNQTTANVSVNGNSEEGGGRYEVLIHQSFKNRVPLLHKEFLWAPFDKKGCVCPKLRMGGMYLVMGNTELSGNGREVKLVLNSQSYIRRYNSKKMHRISELRNHEMKHCLKYRPSLENSEVPINVVENNGEIITGNDTIYKTEAPLNSVNNTIHSDLEVEKKEEPVNEGEKRENELFTVNDIDSFMNEFMKEKSKHQSLRNLLLEMKYKKMFDENTLQNTK